METKLEREFTNMNELTKEQLVAKNHELDSNNRLLAQELKDKNKEIQKLKQEIKILKASNTVDSQMTIENFV